MTSLIDIPLLAASARNRATTCGESGPPAKLVAISSVSAVPTVFALFFMVFPNKKPVLGRRQPYRIKE